MSDELTEDEAEDLLYEAAMNVDRVRSDYPELTEELDTLLSWSRSCTSAAYFRIGREDSRPTLTELAERHGGDLPVLVDEYGHDPDDRDRPEFAEFLTKVRKHEEPFLVGVGHDRADDLEDDP